MLAVQAIRCAAISKRTDERLHKIDAIMDKPVLEQYAHKKAVCLFIRTRSTCIFPLREVKAAKVDLARPFIDSLST